MKRVNKEFRCSSFGNIMVGATLDSSPTLTESQQKELSELLSKIKLTEKQSNRRDELIIKRDKKVQPELSKGAKTYIENEFLKDQFDYSFRFTNRYTQKGLSNCEEKSIREVGQMLKYPFATKSPEKFLSNGLICTSGYDWKVKSFVFDQKNVWNPEGLKLFQEDKDKSIYEWQIRGYAMLINECEGGSIDKGAVIRVLMNPGEDEIIKQARILWCEAGYSYGEEMTEDFVNEVRESFNFESKQPIEKRCRIHSVDCTKEHFKLIRVYIKLAQEYYNSLFDKWDNANKNEIEIFKNF